MNLESPKVTVQKSSKEMFDYLSKIENFENIMPENIEKFEADENSFLFALRGMPEIKLKLQEQEAPKKLVLGSVSDKFPFTLTANIEEKSENSSDVQLLFMLACSDSIFDINKEPNNGRGPVDFAVSFGRKDKTDRKSVV